MAKKWNNRNYLIMKAVTFEKDKLEIEFANGDVSQVSRSVLTPSWAGRVQWAQASISPDRLHLVVPAVPRNIEIAWHVIRSLTHPEFASHMADRAAKQAAHIGNRLRELRKHRGLTQAQVADAAKIEPANLSRIENGHFDVATSTLWKVLAAMGYSPADLAVNEVGKMDANREWAAS
jgi:DNA-binding XRE family transcriptional regulator